MQWASAPGPGGSRASEHRPFDEITIDEIIKAADLSRPAFYYHFAGGEKKTRAELVHPSVLKGKTTQNVKAGLFGDGLRGFFRSRLICRTIIYNDSPRNRTA